MYVARALSAWTFRNDLAAAERLYHPKHGIVLVGHSMGGLVSRMQAVDTGRVLWDEVFGQNADALYAKVPDDNLLRQTLASNRRRRRVLPQQTTTFPTQQSLLLSPSVPSALRFIGRINPSETNRPSERATLDEACSPGYRSWARSCQSA
jgi:hypothetical protein